MRFYYAKKDMTCKGCSVDIQRGEIYVRSFFKTPNNGYYSFSYHPDCFLESFKRRFTNSLNFWVEKLTPPKKIGRPLKTSNPREYKKLKDLLYYYKKTGNKEKMDLLLIQIRQLELQMNL